MVIDRLTLWYTYKPLAIGYHHGKMQSIKRNGPFPIAMLLYCQGSLVFESPMSKKKDKPNYNGNEMIINAVYTSLYGFHCGVLSELALVVKWVNYD